MKKLLIVTIALIMAASLAACSGGSATGSSSSSGGTINDAVSGIADSVRSMIQGDVAGQIGTTYSTRWFDFSIDSIEVVDSYAGQSPEAGYIFVDVVVSEKNTWEGKEEIPMSDADFYLEVEGYEGTAYCLDPFDDSMMPNEFYLQPDEECTYHLIWELPDDVENISFIYVEVAEDDSTYATFTIEHSL